MMIMMDEQVTESVGQLGTLKNDDGNRALKLSICHYSWTKDN